MRIETNITEFATWILDRVNKIDFSPLAPRIREIVRTSIDKNFTEQGRYGNSLFGGGSQKWEKSLAAKNRSGQTLSDTGQLAASININVTQSGKSLVIEIGSNKSYAPVHQFGFDGDVNVKAHTRNRKAHKRRTKTGKVVPVRAHTQDVDSYTRKMNLPKRPFLVLQQQDIDYIKELVIEHIIARLKNG